MNWMLSVCLGLFGNGQCATVVGFDFSGPSAEAACYRARVTAIADHPRLVYAICSNGMPRVIEVGRPPQPLLGFECQGKNCK